MSLIYDNEHLSDSWLVTIGLRVGRWDFTVSWCHRL